MDATNILPDAQPPQRLVALAVARRGKLALVLAGPDRWHESVSYVFIPAAFPGATLAGDGDLAATLEALAQESFGQPAQVISSACVYGPSPAHAIDRLAAEPDERIIPLLRLQRRTPLDTPEGPGLRRIELSVYLARVDDELRAAGGAAGILWVAPPSLRAVLRGMPFAEVVALPGVAWVPASTVALPEEAFVYVPADFGERHLVRIAAKYGQAALFQDDGKR
jgi:hypothetical protein